MTWGRWVSGPRPRAPRPRSPPHALLPSFRPGFSVEGPSQAKIECDDKGDGSCDVRYWPTEPGEYAVHVLCNNEDIQHSPFMAEIVTAPTKDFYPDKVRPHPPLASCWRPLTIARLAGEGTRARSPEQRAGCGHAHRVHRRRQARGEGPSEDRGSGRTDRRGGGQRAGARSNAPVCCARRTAKERRWTSRSRTMGTAPTAAATRLASPLSTPP